MSFALLNCIAWPVMWGLGWRWLWKHMPSDTARRWLLFTPWGYWVYTAALQLVIYSISRPAKGVTIDPRWGSAGNLTAAALWWIWKHRKDIKRKLAALGNKGLARLRSMVRTMQERAKPRQVYKPGWAQV